MSNLTRVDYDTDAAFLEALLDEEFAWAKKERLRTPYNKDFKMRLMVVGPAFQIANTPLIWHSTEEKRRVMWMVAMLSKVIGNKAVLVTIDTRWVQSDAFIEHFKLERPGKDEASEERFFDAYHRILNEHGGEMERLPRHLWSEAVMSSMKTHPSCGLKGDRIKVQPYTRGTGNSIMWIPNNLPRDLGCEMQMLKNWWEIPDDDPTVMEMSKFGDVLLREILGRR